jgi:spermidine synthase
MPAARHGDGRLLLAFLLSGVAALGYELLWTRLLALSLGSESLGVLGVLAGFFGGLALGSFLFHDRARRSPNPLRLFATLEVVAALFAAVSPHLLHALATSLPQWLGSTAGDNDTALALSLSVAVAGITLLPATICMGATLPAMVEARRRARPHDLDGRGLGRLYGANTLGATAGVLVTVLALLPAVGMTWGAIVLSACGLVAAGLALHWGKDVSIDRKPEQEAERPEIDCSRDPDQDVLKEPWLLYVVLFGTGLAGVGLEVLGVQILSQILQNTVYTFANVLAVYLVGTALGAWIYQRFAAAAVAGRPAIVTAAFMVALGLSVAVAAAVLGISPELLRALAPAGSDISRHLVAELVLATAVFFVPTLLMGAAFSHIVGLLADRGVGRAYALNTLGAALAPFVFGLWVLPETGYTDAFYTVAYAYLVLFGIFTWFRRFRPAWQIGAILLVIATTAAGPRDLVLVEEPEGWDLVERHETLLGVVLVSEQEVVKGRKWRRLQVGRHFRMGGALAFGERRMGHIPLLLAPQTERGLFIGVGTGATLGAAQSFPFEHVEAVELVPAVLEAMHLFSEVNLSVRDDARFDFHAADARRYLAASEHKYDVIVADLFHPARDGAGSLYSLEHFETARAHLAEGGLFAQWLPLYQLDEPNLKVVIRTFLAAFDEVHSFLAIYNAQTPALALIGRVPDGTDDVLRVDLERLEQRLAEPVYRGLLELEEMLGAYMLDRDALADFAGPGKLNRDLDPVLLFDAPRSAYEDRDDLSYGGLAALLPHRSRLPPDLLESAHDGRAHKMQEEVATYAAAITHYLEGEIDRVRAGGSERVPMSSIESYLAAYDVQPGFAPARGILYRLASQSPELGDAILPAMYERTPDDVRLQRTYLRYLQVTGDTQRLQEVMAEIGSSTPQQ